MSVIRPAPLPAIPARSGEVARPPQVQAAQRAFFQAALETPASPPRAAPEAARRAAPQPTDRLPRPGSLLDIRV